MPVGCEASLERFAAIRGADRGLGDGGGRDAIRTWNPGLSLRNASYATFRDRQKRRNSKLLGHRLGNGDANGPILHDRLLFAHRSDRFQPPPGE